MNPESGYALDINLKAWHRDAGEVAATFNTMGHSYFGSFGVGLTQQQASRLYELVCEFARGCSDREVQP